MEKLISLNGKEIKYKYKRLRRAKSLTITVKPDASVLVTTPYFFPLLLVEKYLHRQSVWILEKISQFEATKDLSLSSLGLPEYRRYREKSKAFILEKISRLNSVYNFKFKKVTVRNQSTLWGSCSQNGNLSFNYKLYFLPDHLAEYVVVHELCHLAELNHSTKFWNLVAMTIPDYKSRIKELKKRH